MKQILSILSLFICLMANAQTQFITKGRIEYERKLNQFKPFEENESDNEWMKELMKTMPRLVTDVYE
ncbi:MAG: hypothetical protein RLY89_2372, partial [Bacteroidota bacterium]